VSLDGVINGTTQRCRLVLSPTRKETAHRALATQKRLASLGFQCLDHPPYSPDPVPWTEKTIERDVGRAKDLSASRYNLYLCIENFFNGQVVFR
jgi:hypothetical protein